MSGFFKALLHKALCVSGVAGALLAYLLLVGFIWDYFGDTARGIILIVISIIIAIVLAYWAERKDY